MLKNKNGSGNAARLARANVAAKVIKAALPKGAKLTAKTVRVTCKHKALAGQTVFALFARSGHVQVLCPILGVKAGMVHTDRNGTPMLVVTNGPTQHSQLTALGTKLATLLG